VGDYHKERAANGEVGIDLGIKASVTLSTGEQIHGPKALRRNLKKLRRESRRHSRKVRGSANRRKSSMKLARLHRRIGWVRSDFLHKLTTDICRKNHAIGIEGLAVGNMLRNHKLARSIVDEGWGEFRREVTYKAVIYDDEIVVHDRWHPSSKKCFVCGKVKDKLSLSERMFRCECGWKVDRDVNAALNLLPWVTREVTPVDKKALAMQMVKPAWTKQELICGHTCSQKR